MSEILGVDFKDPVMTAFVGTLILIFVISPIIGYIVLTKGAKFSTIFASFGVGLLTLVLLFIGLNLLMGNTLKESDDNNVTVTLISFCLALMMGLCTGIYSGWILANPHSAVDDEIRNSAIARPDESLKYMAKRRERLEKKRRR